MNTIGEILFVCSPARCRQKWSSLIVSYMQQLHRMQMFYLTLIVVKTIFKRFRDLFENPYNPQFLFGFQISFKGTKQYPRPHCV